MFQKGHGKGSITEENAPELEIQVFPNQAPRWAAQWERKDPLRGFARECHHSKIKWRSQKLPERIKAAPHLNQNSTTLLKNKPASEKIYQ